MKIYISGKITGTHDYMERFKKAEDILVKDGWSVINPAEICSHLPKSTTYKQYMEVDLLLLGMCDAIYMINGWESSEGAKVEHQYAEALGLVVIKGE